MHKIHISKFSSESRMEEAHSPDYVYTEDAHVNAMLESWRDWGAEPSVKIATAKAVLVYIRPQWGDIPQELGENFNQRSVAHLQ